MASPLRSSTTPHLLLRHAIHGATPKRSLTTIPPTTTPPPPAAAAEAAQQLQQTFQDHIITHHQALDAHHLQKLSLTLNRPHLHPCTQDITTTPPPSGTPLPPGYHLAYLSPAALEADLAPDGTDRTFNAPAPFSRRMWAGGQMSWTPGVPLRVGDVVEEKTRLVGAAGKRSRGGGGPGMVLVEVEKEFWGPRGLALVDRRSWVFRPPAPARGEGHVKGAAVGSGAAGGRRSSVEDIKGVNGTERKLTWSPVALFRFSALTFNAHKIHYDEAWARDVEGHPGLVVHGPLNLIAMLDYFRDVHGGGGGGKVLLPPPREISYRALSPLYAGEEYTIRTESEREEGERGTVFEVVVAKGDTLCMRGSILCDGVERVL